MEQKDGAEWSLSTLGEPMSLIKTGFERFWETWPKNPRKGAKAECKKKWDKLECELSVDTILKHIEWLKTTEQWRKNDGSFIPAPLVYLNQQRWDGAEIPEIKPPTARDDTLIKLDESRKRAVPMPDDVRERLAQLRGVM
jgi:hypothetical protein